MAKGYPPQSRIRAAGKEMKKNPPGALARTRRKSGAGRANKQRVAIMLDKARRSMKR